ncbi:MAG: cupin domain-containing protein [Myxococcota bacterium]|jgi:mannose-6-phosphate isomerase-like protein (cupin superfamily)
MSARETGPFDLSKSPIHLPSDATAPAVPIHAFGFDGPSFEKYIAKHCTPGAPGRLAMIESSSTNWSAWECHEAGDELVFVLEGEGDFLQEIDGGTRSAPFGPGSTFINPAGVWHTANVRKPMRAIYLTPCPGTKHRGR